ncbi:MAG: GmrSD restriction endonuclease domain-containing protein, partial [Candidatus Dormibacteria bacterium]
VTGALNPAMSNAPWPQKCAALLQHSALALNAELIRRDVWDESAIEIRAVELATAVQQIWPGP